MGGKAKHVGHFNHKTIKQHTIKYLLSETSVDVVRILIKGRERKAGVF